MPIDVYNLLYALRTRKAKKSPRALRFELVPGQAPRAVAGISDSLPEIIVEAPLLDEGIAVYTLLIQAGFAASNGEAKRLIEGGGAKINDAAVSNVNEVLRSDGADIKLSAGKKRHVLVKAD